MRAIGGSFSRNACLRVVPFAVCSGWTSRRGSFAADANAGKRWRKKVREQLQASGAENLHAAIHQDLHDEHDEL